MKFQAQLQNSSVPRHIAHKYTKTNIFFFFLSKSYIFKLSSISFFYYRTQIILDQFCIKPRNALQFLILFLNISVL